MKTAIYVRISQDTTGKRAGVTRQLEDCQQLAQRLDWEVVKTFDDNDLSAYSGKTRPAFEDMLAAARRGEIGAIVCWHPDRLYRSLKDLERLVEATDHGVHIATVNGGDFDLSNATGKMLARILGSVSRMESEHKGERRRRANEQRAAAGTWRADAPRIFGYTKKGEPLEPEAAAVRQAATDVLDGVSLRSIANKWNSRGILSARGKGWSNLTLRRMLMNPTYAALRTYRGQITGPGTWEALIDEDTHHGLVSFLSDVSRRPTTSFERKHVGSGIFRCGVCGEPLYATGPGRNRQRVYSCRASAGKHVGRVAAPLDELIEATALAVLSDADIVDRLCRRDDIDVAALHGKRNGLQARMTQLSVMFASGDVDADQLKAGTAELKKQITGIDNALADHMRTSPAARFVTDGTDDLTARWTALSADIRGKIIDELMTVTVLPTPRGVRGVTIDRDTGAYEVNLDYCRVEPK